MTEESMPDEKRMRLRYAGTCRLCDVELQSKVEAIYERTTKTVRCLDCSTAANEVEAPIFEPEPDGAVDAGTPGASARREFERRQGRREERIRSSTRSSEVSSWL